MVRNKFFSALIYIVVGLAGVGLVSQLFTNTVSFLTTVFMMIGFGVAAFAVIYFFFLKKRTTSNDSKKYKQAAKQSKSKYHSQKSKPQNTAKAKRPQPQPIKKKFNKRASHLRVIDGNKSKRKDRATF